MNYFISKVKCILFKVALIVFDCLLGQGPGYVDDVLLPVHTIGARARVRSADHGDMVCPAFMHCAFQSVQFPHIHTHGMTFHLN